MSHEIAFCLLCFFVSLVLTSFLFIAYIHGRGFLVIF